MARGAKCLFGIGVTLYFLIGVIELHPMSNHLKKNPPILTPASWKNTHFPLAIEIQNNAAQLRMAAFPSLYWIFLSRCGSQATPARHFVVVTCLKCDS